MVEESVEHAFEDLAARRWSEARLKARELSSATRKGLNDCEGELDENVRAGIQAALQRVEQALLDENPITQTGDLKELQAANANLDELTKPLAELLMDKAMEAMLRKRGVLD